MKMTDALKWMVGIVLTLFIFIFLNIILFGLVNTVSGISINVFKTLYFSFFLALLGSIYIININRLKTRYVHILLIFSLLAFSASLSVFVGNFKESIDVDKYLADTEGLRANLMYNLQYAESILQDAKQLDNNNLLLDEKAASLSERLNNKEPVIIETVLTVPGKIIYVQEDAPINRIYEEEDDE